MQKPTNTLRIRSGLTTLLFITLIIACSKGGDSGSQTNPCEGVTVNVTGTTLDADAGTSNGSITASATGGSGFTYQLNTGTFQISGTFNNLAKGTYTITAKNANGCTGSTSIQVREKVGCTGTPGPKFLEVKALVQTKCAISGCHTGAAPTGNLNLSVECNILLNKDKINNRAVITGDMPQTGPLTTGEKQKITDWINAGGKITD